MSLSSHRADIRRNIQTALRVGMTVEQIGLAVPGATPQFIKLVADQRERERKLHAARDAARKEQRRKEREKYQRKMEAEAKLMAERGEVSTGMEQHAMGARVGGQPPGHLRPWPDMARMYEDIDEVTLRRELVGNAYRVQPTQQTFTLGGVA